MCIVKDRKTKQSPSGAACGASMPLLTELGDLLLFDSYKHAAPPGLNRLLGQIIDRAHSGLHLFDDRQSAGDGVFLRLAGE